MEAAHRGRNLKLHWVITKVICMVNHILPTTRPLYRIVCVCWIRKDYLKGPASPEHRQDYITLL